MKEAYKLILAFEIVLLIGLVIFLGVRNLDKKTTLTGEAVLEENSTEEALPPVSEHVLLDAQKYLDVDTNCVREFEVEGLAQITIDITSDKLVNYFLLSEDELKPYLNGQTFHSYANFNKTLFIQDSYNLTTEKYAVVIVSLDEPANINLIIKQKQ
jgi:hypothetical protein